MTDADARATSPGQRFIDVVVVPTSRAALLVVAAAVLTALRPNVVPALLPVGVALAAIVVDGVLAPSPRRIGVARELPRTIPLGAAGEVVWRVENPTTRRRLVAFADDLAPSLGASTRRGEVRVPPRGEHRVSARLEPLRRGTFRPERITVRTVGPMGLGVRQATRSLPGVIEIHPRFSSRAAAELRLRRARLLEQGHRAMRARGTSIEFESLREYVDGDELRHVDWAATARTGRPIVRTYRAERNQTVLVLQDVGRVVAGTVAGVPRLDHCMDATLALATVAQNLGDRVGLITFGHRVHELLAPRRDPGQLRRISSALHALEPELGASAYDEAVAAVLARFRRRALVVVVTELAAETTATSLLPAVRGIASDHVVIVAAVQDPYLRTMVRTAAGDVAGAYRSAAAAATLSARSEVAGRLRTRGVTVVDRVPGLAAPALVDAYLEIKAKGGW